jgi:ligand-binding sensor domain-containing protein/signal transduction histidine kinase
MIRAMTRRSLMAVVAIALAAQSRPAAERLPLRNYRTADGLPHDRIKSILRDSRGFLWFCTVEGLARFDGDRFTRYTVDDGLPNQSVNDIIEGSPGTYWIAPNGGGLSRFDADRARFTTIPLSEGFLPNRVNAVQLDRKGRVWAGTDDGLFWIDGRSSSPAPRREQLPAGAGSSILRLLTGRDGSLWIVTGRALLCRTPAGDYLAYTVTDEAGIVQAIAEDSSGRIWAGGTKGLLAFRPPPMAAAARGSFTLALRHSGNEGAIDPAPGTAIVVDSVGPVGALLSGSTGVIWIGTIAGALVAFDGARISRYESAHGFTESRIIALAEDPDRNLWIGTYSAGAFRLARDGLVSYGRIDGLPDAFIAAIVEDRAGRLIVATHDGAFSRFDGRRFAPIRLPPALGPLVRYSGEIWQQFVLQARSGDWWLRTAAGAFHLRDARGEPSALVEDFGRGGALADRVIERLYEDRRGHIWIATRPQAGSSLAEWDPAGGLRVFDAGDGLPATGHPRAFAEDRYGALWIGFSDNGGLARREGGRFQFWTKDAGVPAGEVRAVFRDRRDRLWVAADVGGLRLITGENTDRPRFDPWTTAQGLASNNTRALADDDRGRVYVGTELGVDRIDPDTRIVRHYTTADGLASNEVDVASTTRDGSVWFGTYSGLSRLVPDHDHADTPPPIWIYSVRVADTPVPIDALGATRLSLPPIEPRDDRVAVEFGSLEFGAHGAVRYEYRLDGVDRDWQRARDEHRVTYARLGAGRYRFQVRAVTESGVASLQPSVIDFSVRPPLWLRSWFLGLAVTAIALAAYALHRVRVARLVEIERVRLRIAVDLHDDIGASLSRIAILSEVARRQAAGAGSNLDAALARIAMTSREVVDSMTDIVWAIDPHRDSLGDLTRRMRRFASDVLASRGVDLQFVAPPDGVAQHLGHDVRRQLLLVLKESVNNIGRHAGCSQTLIELRASSDAITLVVRDNGCGFDAAASAAGHGLASMRQRVAGLGGTIEIRSNPGKGTEVAVTVPSRARLSLDYLRR